MKDIDTLALQRRLIKSPGAQHLVAILSTEELRHTRKLEATFSKQTHPGAPVWLELLSKFELGGHERPGGTFVSVLEALEYRASRIDELSEQELKKFNYYCEEIAQSFLRDDSEDMSEP